MRDTDGGRYESNIHINANKVYNNIEGPSSANLDASLKGTVDRIPLDSTILILSMS